MVWQGTLQDNELENITDSVAQDVDSVLYAIKYCSDAFKNLFPLYAPMYAIVSPTMWVIYALSQPQPLAFSSWFGDLRKHRTFRTCINATALNWKSQIKNGLWGIA